LYEAKPVKAEQELRKSFSQMSLEERKTKKVSQKNSTRKKAVSAAATGHTNWQQTEEHTARPLIKRESMKFCGFFLFAPACFRERFSTLSVQRNQAIT